jgi:Holliday junction resolvasome RuvABC ATP-dependent DNA helicase subunit
MISKKLKSHHITFVDDITRQEKPVAEVIIVESYKEYNLENIVPAGNNDKCCSIL